ncbi:MULTISPECIES: hypothetical protein [Serratia]|uniref:hypothetical protein n=1 Tax=Serratia TaxID=613 RepID=UPI00066160E2|nr:hypothetical protein [Serratia sp. 506_PEND]
MIYMKVISGLFVLLVLVFSFSVQARMDMNDISELAIKKIKENHLTTLKQECVSFEYQYENELYVFFSVLENNTSAVCRGDENFSVKLFDMEYEEKNGYFFVEDDMNPGSYQRLN